MTDQPLALALLLYALAVARGARLVAVDELFRPLRERLDSWGDRSPVGAWLHYLLTCPWCLSVHLAGAAVAGELLVPQVARWVAAWLALALVGAYVAALTSD